MAQASSCKSTVRYQVCNSNADDEPSKKSTDENKSLIRSTIESDDLCEITISSINQCQSQSRPNHFDSSTNSNIIRNLRENDDPSRRLLSSSTISNNPSAHPRSSPRPSIFGTLTTTLTAVRKSSTSALALAQQRLSSDNGNLFSAYQGLLK